MNIDWKLLRERIEHCMNEAENNKKTASLMYESIIFMSALQDDAVANGTPEEEVYGDPFANCFMTPEIYESDYVEVDTTSGTETVPFPFRGDIQDYLEGKAYPNQDLGIKHGYLARLSASGYMDCTDWSAHDTYEDAMQYLKDTYA